MPVPSTTSPVPMQRGMLSPLSGKSPSGAPSPLAGVSLKKHASEPPTAAATAKALKKDLVAMQNLIDASTTSSSGVGSYGMRRLEAELTSLSITPGVMTTGNPAEGGAAQNITATKAPQDLSVLLELLSLVGTKSNEVAHAYGVPPPPQHQQSPAMKKKKESSGGIAAAAAAATTGQPHESTTVVGRLLDSVSHFSTLVQQGGGQHGIPPIVVNDGTESGAGMKQQHRKGGGGAGSAGTSSVTSSANATPECANLDAIQEHGGNEGGGNDSDDEHQQQRATVVLDLDGEQQQQNAEQQQQQQRIALSADSQSQLRRLGIEVTTDSDGNIKIDEIIGKLCGAARGVNNTKQQVEYRVESTRDAQAQKIRQLKLELEQTQKTLGEKDGELQDVLRSVNSSRFGVNQSRPLATINDAPMSYEVEKNYKRDLHRAALRIKELEDDYQKLFNDGIDDRQKVKDLTNEVASLKQDISKLHSHIKDVGHERDQNLSLFEGISQTRKEEARMSLTAVKQLEGRIESLLKDVDDREKEIANLKENFKASFVLWCDAESTVKQMKTDMHLLTEEYSAYRQFYTHDNLLLLEHCQHELLKVWRKADEQEAQITIMKQQLEDAQVQKNLATQENHAFMEKVKSSTEWKLSHARSPDETKALAVRLVVLTGDRDKKESSMAASHQERLGLLKQRAEKELSSRSERRGKDIVPVKSEDADNGFKGKRLMQERRKIKMEEAEKRSSAKKDKEYTDEYVDECMQRPISFVDYFEEKYGEED